MLRPLLIASLLSVGTSLGPAQPGRALPIGVKAASRIEGGGISGPSLEIRLRGDAGEPIPLAAVQLLLSGREPIVLVTDSHGRVRWSPLREDLDEEPAPKSVDWIVRFPGSTRYGPSEQRGTLHLDVEATALSLVSSAEKLRLGDPPARFEVRLTDPRGAPLPGMTVGFRIADGPLQRGRTGGQGELALLLDPTFVPARGVDDLSARVEVTFDGDRGRAPASAALELPRVMRTRVTVRAAREGDADGGRLRFSGRAIHERGAWVNAPVRVMIQSEDGGTSVALPAVSDERGIWNAAADLKTLRALGLSRVRVAAHAAPTGNLGGAMSRLLTLEVPRAPGRAWTTPLLLLLTLVLLAPVMRPDGRARLIAAVDRLVLGLKAIIFRLRRRGNAPPSPAAPLVLRRQGSLARAPRPNVVQLRFRDADSDQPVRSTVRIAWRPDSGAAGGTQRATGRGVELVFEGRGTCGIVGQDPLYMPFALELRVPHDGAYDGAVLRLKRVERRVRELHATLVEARGGSMAWGVETPRETRSALLREGETGDPLLEAATAAIEKAYFGVAPPTPEEVASLEQRVEAS